MTLFSPSIPFPPFPPIMTLSPLTRSLRRLALAAILFSALAPAGLAHAATIGMPQNNLGLVGYWPLDGSQTNWATGKTNDISGNGNTGSLVNMSTSTSPVAGKIGQALRFNGGSQQVTIPNLYSTALNTATTTVTAWIYLTSTPTAYVGNVATYDDGFNTIQFAVDVSGSSFGSNARKVLDRCGNRSATVLGLNKWYFVAVSEDGITGHMYINGVLDASAACGSVFGASYGGPYINIGGGIPGTVDDVRVYNRVLSASEVQALYHAGAATVAHANTVAVSNGLVGYWPLDGATTNWSTNTTSDLSGNGDALNLVNMSTSTSPVAGKIGQALNFNGTSQYLKSSAVSNGGLLDLSSSFSLSAWTDMTSVPQGQYAYLSMFSYGNYYQYGMSITYTNYNSNYWFGCGNYNGSAGYFMGYTYPYNTWQFYTCTYDGTNFKLYINSQLVATSGAVSPYYVSGTPKYMYVGSYGTGYYFPGRIDDSRVYNRALSASEVQQLYQLGAANVAHSNAGTNAPLSSGLVGYWTMDGSHTHWNTGTEDDSSGNGNTGSLVGMSTSTSPVAGKIGQALQFNGSSGYLYTTTNQGSGTALNTMTASAWFKTAVASGHKIVGLENTQTGTGSTLYDRQIYMGTDGKIYGYVWDGAAKYVTSTAAYNDGKWHLATIVIVSNSTMSLYIDGAYITSTAIGTPFDSYSPSFWRVGSYKNAATNGSDGYFSGSIDDVRIYNRALSASEVQQLYNMGR